MTEEEFLVAIRASRVKVAEAIQEFVNLKAEYSVGEESSDHYGQAPHGHMLSYAVVCYQSICLSREDGKAGYQVNYFSATDGTMAADFGVVCVARDQMSADLCD